MNRTKIEWCAHTWNPVTGCRHGCPYCLGQDDKPIYWIRWAGNALAADESECVRLDAGETPK